MNFTEYVELKEETKMYKYVLFNTKSKYAPTHNGELFITWAVSSIKAYHQILHTLREDHPERYMNDIRANRGNYVALPIEDYREIQAKRKKYNDSLKPKEEPEEEQQAPETPTAPSKPQQMDMFPRGMPD